jgi:hypothetical protein
MTEKQRQPERLVYVRITWTVNTTRATHEGISSVNDADDVEDLLDAVDDGIVRHLPDVPWYEGERRAARDELQRENVALRRALQDARGSGGQGVRMHDVFPRCGHTSLTKDCLGCAQEDARRCAAFENVYHRKYHAVCRYLENIGSDVESFEAWWEKDLEDEQAGEDET